MTKVAEKVKTHTFYSITFLKYRPDYEMMWENTVQPGKAQMTIWRMRIACWIPKVTDTDKVTICNIYCLATATKVERKRLSAVLHVHFLPC